MFAIYVAIVYWELTLRPVFKISLQFYDCQQNNIATIWAQAEIPVHMLN